MTMRPLVLAIALMAGPALADTDARDAEHAFIIGVMERIQPMSIEQNREFCGFIGYDRNGELQTSEILVGTEDTCRLPDVPDKLDVIASWHTHSTYSPEYRSEYPSTQDLRSDNYFDVNGYVITPGGRVWFHDRHAATITQVCELKCVYQDPNFQEEPGDPTLMTYSRRMLEKLEGPR